MKSRWATVFLMLMLMVNSVASHGKTREKTEAAKDSTAVAVVHPDNSDFMRVQGEQRFRSNCGRCHAAPQKFSPRIMKTVIRHMRVRATITEDDMRMILFYMTQ